MCHLAQERPAVALPATARRGERKHRDATLACPLAGSKETPSSLAERRGTRRCEKALPRPARRPFLPASTVRANLVLPKAQAVSVVRARLRHRSSSAGARKPLAHQNSDSAPLLELRQFLFRNAERVPPELRRIRGPLGRESSTKIIVSSKQAIEHRMCRTPYRRKLAKLQTCWLPRCL